MSIPDAETPEVGAPAATPSPEVIEALQSRATDLSRAIDNPATLAKKLRESLVDLVGPEAAMGFALTAAYDHATGAAKFQIAAATPNFLAKLESTAGATHLGLSYRKTSGGWTLEVGVEAGMTRGFLEKRLKSDDYSLAGSFTVTLRR